MFGVFDGREVPRIDPGGLQDVAIDDKDAPSPIAPMASSGWVGTPSLRTTTTSSGAPRAAATSWKAEHDHV